MSDNFSLHIKKCVHAGCTETIPCVQLPSNWYKCQTGFMSWSCPTHALVWKEYDKTQREYWNKRAQETSEALVKFEQEWDAQYDLKYPVPESPPSQPSH